MNIQSVLQTDFVSAVLMRTVGEPYKVVRRPAAYVVKSEIEDERNIERLIVLPPFGFTANKVYQTNSYSDVEKATIEILGAVRTGKHGFSTIKDCLLTVSFNDESLYSQLDQPYLEYDLNDPKPAFTTRINSAGEPPFYVVKPDGSGIYHALRNLKDEWLILKLKKALRPQKKADMKQFFKSMQYEHVVLFKDLAAAIQEHGDKVFHNRQPLIDKVLQVPANISLPVLGEMLYFRDKGNHETCSVFALILKIGREDTSKTLEYLHRSKLNSSIPGYFVDQLIAKLMDVSGRTEGNTDMRFG